VYELRFVVVPNFVSACGRAAIGPEEGSEVGLGRNGRRETGGAKLLMLWV